MERVIPTMGHPSKYNTMDDFLEEYRRILEEQYEICNLLQAVPFAKSGKRVDTNTKKENTYYQRRREIEQAQSNRRGDVFPLRTNLNNVHSGHNNNSTEEYMETEDCWREVHGRRDDGGYESQDSISVESERANEELLEHEQPRLDQREFQESNPEKEILLAAFENQSGMIDRKALPCLKKLMKGKCEHADCQFGHKHDVLVRGALEMRDKLDSFLKGQGPEVKGKVFRESPDKVKFLKREDNRRHNL